MSWRDEDSFQAALPQVWQSLGNRPQSIGAEEEPQAGGTLHASTPPGSSRGESSSHWEAWRRSARVAVVTLTCPYAAPVTAEVDQSA